MATDLEGLKALSQNFGHDEINATADYVVLACLARTPANIQFAVNQSSWVPPKVRAHKEGALEARLYRSSSRRHLLEVVITVLE